MHSIKKKIKNFYKFFNKFLFLFFIILLLLTLVLPPIIIKDETLIFGGSTSVSLLFSQLKTLKKENTFSENSDVDFYYHSIGSSSALKRIFDDSFYIGFLSRKPKLEEIKFFANHNDDLIDDLRLTKIAEDDIVFGYHLPKTCNIKNKSKQLNFSWSTLKNIWSQKKSYWNDVQNVKCTKKQQQIYRINRENGSGTRDVFSEKIAKPDIFYESIIGSTSVILDRIYHNENTLSYFSQAYLKQIQDYHQENHKINYATIENISFDQKDYSFRRPFFALYLKKNKERIQKFINFYQNKKVKQKIKEKGYRWKWKEGRF